MNGNRVLFIMNDSTGKVIKAPDYSQGVPESFLKKHNDEGCGIFLSVNNFYDNNRKKDSLAKINAWYVEVDSKTTKKFPIEPSLTIESKSGYHFYFFAKDATVENYASIERGLVECIGGDDHAMDITRVLRVPGYYHCKDPNNKFMIKEIQRSNKIYTEKEMLNNFPCSKRKEITSKRNLALIVSIYFLIEYYNIELSAGNKYKCPVWEHSNPAFTIYPESNSWHCFGCNKGGSVIDLIMHIENINCIDAAVKIGEIKERYKNEF